MAYIGEPFNKDYFTGKRSDGYTDYTKTTVVHYNRAQDIETLFGNLKNKKICVFGCAHGYLVNELNKLEAEVTGVDISKYAIAEAKILFPSLTFVEGDALSSGLTANSFDIITICEMLECMNNTTDADSLIAEAKKLLRTNGKLYILTMDKAVESYKVFTNAELTTLKNNNFSSKAMTITNTGDKPINAHKRVVIV